MAVRACLSQPSTARFTSPCFAHRPLLALCCSPPHCMASSWDYLPVLVTRPLLAVDAAALHTAWLRLAPTSLQARHRPLLQGSVPQPPHCMASVYLLPHEPYTVRLYEPTSQALPAACSARPMPRRSLPLLHMPLHLHLLLLLLLSSTSLMPGICAYGWTASCSTGPMPITRTWSAAASLPPRARSYLLLALACPRHARLLYWFSHCPAAPTALRVTASTSCWGVEPGREVDRIVNYGDYSRLRLGSAGCLPSREGQDAAIPMSVHDSSRKKLIGRLKTEAMVWRRAAAGW